MNFIESRGNDGKRPHQISFSSAILSPMSSFGGIYVPETLPSLGSDFLRLHQQSDYKTLSKAILELCKIDVDEEVIDKALQCYDHFDDPKNPVPVVKVNDSFYVSELFHGPTRSFKDMALQPFGVVLSSIAQQRNEQYLIMAATSGDTGPAALETFKNKANVRVACLYPDGGTSDVQRLQMVTEDAKNLKVIGIHGNFDDAQAALKSLLSSDEFNETLNRNNIKLSAANSVNFGRIIFQMVYHIWSYLELVRQDAIKLGEKVYLDVPSGNFGNALGGYYAMKMGLPVEKILIASNSNNVLTSLINEGMYDLREASLILTNSPAMDILKSSNVERVLFDLFGAERTKELMMQLDEQRYYTLKDNELIMLQEIFAADYCNDSEGKQYIQSTYEQGYLLDPHTATCLKPYETCRENHALKTIAYSTAEWTKFSPTIANALIHESNMTDEEALASIAAKANIQIPELISALFNKPVVQDSVVDKETISDEILAFVS